MSGISSITPSASRICIGVGDMAASNDADSILATYALGSCIGVVAYDPVAKAGGILHLMLPDSSILPEKAAAQPAMFADTGLPEFFRLLASLRAERSRLQLLVAGGAHMLMGQDPFRIGESNWRATTDYLKANGHPVRHVEVGGTVNRSLTLELATGVVTIRMPNSVHQISLAEEPTAQTAAFRRTG
jgi:chemotaxis protein CheD